MSQRIVINTAVADFDALRIRIGADEQTVEPKVMDVLRVLIDQAGEVITRDALIDQVWGVSFGGDERLSRAISILRRVLGDKAGERGFIETVPRRGYRLVADVGYEDPAPAQEGLALPKESTSAGQASPASPPQGDRRGSAPPMAILPLRNLTGREDLSRFSDMLTLDLIDGLSGSSDVRVVPTASIAAYLVGEDYDLRRLAAEVGLRYLAQGSVREKAGGVMVSLQVVSADLLDVVWSEGFSFPKDLPGDAVEEGTEAIIAALRSQTHMLEIERIRRNPRDLTARDAVLRAVASTRKMTPESFLYAMQQAQLALSIDPEYALARALSANIQAVIYYETLPDNPVLAESIRKEAEAAVQQEPDNPVVLSTAANALVYTGYLEDGLDLARRSIRLDPNNVFAYQPAGAAAALLDRDEEAIEFLNKGVALSPNEVFNWISHLWRVAAHSRAGQWSEANAAADDGLTLAPDNAAPNISKAIIARQLQQHDLATKHFAIARRCEPETPLEKWELRYRRTYEGHPVWEEFVMHLRTLWEEERKQLESRFSSASGKTT
ncbi:MAG: winged helix-turn-helix domain-containing protein [Pseudomonadota bacterium]